MPPHSLTSFEIQKYYENEPNFKCVYSKNNLPKINDGAYLINLDEYKSIGTHWNALNVNDNNWSASYDATNFDRVVVEQIPKEIKKIIGNKNIITNLYRKQAYKLIMCACFCILFIDFIPKGKS